MAASPAERSSSREETTPRSHQEPELLPGATMRDGGRGSQSRWRGQEPESMDPSFGDYYLKYQPIDWIFCVFDVALQLF
ncbi:unnamed protein product [Pleuronectes platessa]|uniref:Uncharacterized protein n=1 Tax=Pleuronectes platessa TaxID=8262 RepID=A0A9N7Z4J8_PLEPL|nr:unnamed protein product [Pleuronectes platessa]